MDNTPPRILVLMMYSGEQEFSASKDALAQQSYTHHDLITIEHLPSRDAHHRLYQTIMDRAGDYGLFLKLDADMVLSDRDALARIVASFQSSPGADHIIFAVRDFLPGQLSLGLHAFSHRVRWELPQDGLFVDPNPVCPGVQKVIWDDIPPVAVHAPDPSPYHAFHFGLHRGLKAFQWDRASAHPQAINMFKTLEATWEHFARSKDIRPGLAMMGADLARCGQLSQNAANKADAAAIAAFDTVKNFSADAMFNHLNGFWGNKIFRRLYWYGLVYPRILPAAILRKAGFLPKLK